MPDIKISSGADPGTLVATDKVPLARSASTAAYAATMAEFASYTSAAYVPNYYTGMPNMDATAAPGTLAFVSRGDHVHPSDTTRQTAAQVAAAVAPALNDVGRNLIHNAGFTVAQRGAGPFSANAYSLDRWGVGVVSDTISIAQGVMSDANRAQVGDEAATYYLSNVFTGNAAVGALNYVWQPIEDVRRLAGKTVTVSFYAAAGATPKLGVNISQVFGTGGSPSAALNGAGQSVTLTTSFVRYSLTFTVPSIAGKTLGTNGNSYTGLQIWFSSGATNNAIAGGIGVQSGTILLWGVQLEIGSVATPLEKRDPVLELQQCQRFYQGGTTIQASVYGAGPGGFSTSTISFPTMRAPPTAVLSGQSYGNATAVSVGIQSSSGFYATVTQTSGGFAYASFVLALSADL